MKKSVFWSKHFLAASVALSIGSLASPVGAQKKYDVGASDTEIKIGQTMPYSGPASAFGTMGKVEAAYFKMLNDRGGINKRKINFISLDDGYSPPKTVEMVRRLVEQDEVLFLMSTLGTPSNTAIHKYMNAKKVPHLFLVSGASKWNDPKNYPWTIAYTPNYQSEAKLYALDILRNKPNAKIAVLYQNDDYGRDYLKGLKEGLGEAAKTLIVAEQTYEVTDPTIDSQIVSLKGSGADTLLNITTPKFAAQAIRKVAEIGWKPLHYVNSISISIGAVLKPAGVDNAVGLISIQYTKNPTDPAWSNDPVMKEYFAFLKKYAPDVGADDGYGTTGYAMAQLMEQVLKQCGDNLTRENVMKQAASLKNFQVPMVIPGILANTGPDDYALFKAMQLVKFDGTTWVPYGKLVDVK